MFTMRGDAHRIFLQLKKTLQSGHSVKTIKDFTKVEEIQILYQSLDTPTLKVIYYRMVKEKNGSGIIPIFVTSIPWLLFLFSEPLIDFLFKDGSSLWIVFGFIYLTILTLSVILHFHERAWAAFHLEIIQDILTDRKSGGVNHLYPDDIQ